jgi:hypothetical protein
MNARRCVGLVISLFGIAVLGAPRWAHASRGSLELDNIIDRKYTSANWGFAHYSGAQEGRDKYDSLYYAMYDPSGVAAKIVSIVDGDEYDADVRPVDSTSSVTVYLSIMFQSGGSRYFESDNELRIVLHHHDGEDFPDEDVYVTIDGQTYDARTTSVIPLPRIEGVVTSGQAYKTLTVSFMKKPASAQVETLSATDVTYTSATLNGRIAGDAQDCRYWFTYWADENPEVIFTSKLGYGANAGDEFSQTISDLKPDTTYSYQAHASNERNSTSGGLRGFTTRGLLADLTDAPGRLLILSPFSKTSPQYYELRFESGGTEGTDDPHDLEYIYYIGSSPPPAIVSTVEGDLLRVDSRGINSSSPVHLEQVLFSNRESIIFPLKKTNVLEFSFPEDEGTNAQFGDRILTFQEYDPNDPNAAFPVYLVRRLIEDGNGVGTMPLPDIPKNAPIYAGTWHYFILRTDKISLADFNDDRVVDGNDYAAVLRDLGKVGNSMGDVASLKDDGTLVVGIPDGKVDEIDVAGFEQERARVEALWAAVYGGQGTSGGSTSDDSDDDDTPDDSSSLFLEGFEGNLGSEWSFAGDLPWRIVSSEAHAGNQCAKAGEIDNGQTTSLTLQRACQKGKIRFWRKVSSEAGFDPYRFFIGGILQEETSGEADWRQVSFPLRWAGSYLFEWRYEKDQAASGGSDTVWIDDVEIVK